MKVLLKFYLGQVNQDGNVCKNISGGEIHFDLHTCKTCGADTENAAHTLINALNRKLPDMIKKMGHVVPERDLSTDNPYNSQPGLGGPTNG